MAIPMPVVNENFDEDVYSELGDLRSELAKKDAEIQYLRHIVQDRETRHIGKQAIKQADVSLVVREEKVPVDNLTNDDIARYSRQLVLPEIGVPGQLMLKRTSVLIVGAGGLGCPAAIYLAAAGIGKIGIVDHDEVEVNNLHRQILHKEKTIGVPKAESVADSVSELNSSVVAIPHYLQLNSSNALAIVKQYDIIVDATDNVATRYLLSDACVLAARPLVSGSALRFEGQLTVYNHKGGPCYRCLFPTPPTPEAVTNCSDGGVIGAVPGVIGCLQSLEVIKIATGLEASYCQKMLVFDGLTGITRTVKLRPRQPNCAVCGTNPSIRKLIDYEQFCGQSASDKGQKVNLLKQEDRISCAEYKSIVEQQHRHLLIDVRPEVELGICRLPDSINIPLTQLERETDLPELKLMIKKTMANTQSNMLPVFVVCRQGNDSQLAVETLKLKLENMPVNIKDIKGGLHAWAKDVDPAFPVY